MSYNPYGPSNSPQTAAWPTEPSAAPVPGWGSGQGYGGPGMPPAGPQNSNTALIVVLVLLAVAALGAGVFFVTSGGDDDDPDTQTAGNNTPTGNTTPPDGSTDNGNPGPVTTLPDDVDIDLPDAPGAPDVPPEVAAADAGPPEDPPTGSAEFDDLASQCYQGSMQACDDLFLQTPVGSEYEAYGDTCGARVSDSHGYYCTDLLPDPEPPAG